MTAVNIDIISDIKSATIDALKALYELDFDADKLVINETRKEFEGSFTVVCFPFAKTAKKAPVQIGEELGTFFKSNTDFVIDFNVVQGFLNLVIKDSFWTSFVATGTLPKLEATGETIMVEYSSPNTNKPLHLGHIRNNLLGYAISEILKAAGNKVVKANLINDRGIHICKSMLAWQKFGQGETPETNGIKGDKLVGNYYVAFDKAYKAEIQELIDTGKSEEEAKKQAPIILEAQEMLRKWENNDSEVRALWETMNSWVYKGFEVTYNSLGVDFDQNYYESNTYLLGKSQVEEGLANKACFKKEDGSIWIDLEKDGLDHKLLLRADGTSVYITQDIGTAQLKYDDHKMDRSVYVVGNEQDYHFKVLQLVLKHFDKPHAQGIYHLSYGMVELPSGKMKSREGTVVDADDLIAEMYNTAKSRTEDKGKIDNFTTEESEALFHNIGMGALKFYLLKVDPKKGIMFNPEESIEFQGQTGPFIQYTHARIKSILRSAPVLDVDPITYTDLKEEERCLAQLIFKANDVIKEAASKMDPSHIANYAYELAKSFSSFYGQYSVLKEEDKAAMAFRIALCKFTASTIDNMISLLGINVPEKM